MRDLDRFAHDVRTGLTSSPKHLSTQWIYDDRGSRLFQEIMALPTYYLTRSETEILDRHGPDIARHLHEHMAGRDFDIVELGAGDGTKTQRLLRALLDREAAVRYVPCDIDPGILHTLRDRLAGEMPDLAVAPLACTHADWFERTMEDRPKVVLFLGSNLGNMVHDHGLDFVRRIAGRMGPDDLMMLGLDRRKDPRRILAAYDDAEGITAAFNKNLLHRINATFHADFPVDAFHFYPSYDVRTGEVRSCLLATRAMDVRIADLDLDVHLDAWEPIHTEISRKFNGEDLEEMAAHADIRVSSRWTDAQDDFMDVVFAPA